MDRRRLAGRSARNVPWPATAATAAACTVFVWARAARVDAALELVTPLRLSAVLLAAAAAGCLEDAAEGVTQTTAVGRLRRRTLGVVLTAGLVAVLWCVILFGASLLAGTTPGAPALPVVGLSVELLAACTVGWAIAAWIVARTGWRGSTTRAAAGVVAAALVSLAHPTVVDWLWAMPGPGPSWSDTHEHWAVVGTVALVGFVVLSRDPASRRLVARSAGSPGSRGSSGSRRRAR